MNEVLWVSSAIILLLTLFFLTAVGFYRAGYAKGYLASHKIVLEMNENFLQVLAIARAYEKELERLEQDD